MRNRAKLYVSERILLLRIIDVLSLLTGLTLCNRLLDFTYINPLENILSKNTITLIIYYLISAQIFQLFNLVDSASRFKTVKNLFVVTLTVCVSYLYTPILTPVLPSNRIDILIFILCVFCSVFVWRNIYVLIIAGKHFFKPIIIINGDKESIKEVVELVGHSSNENEIFGYIAKKEVHGINGYYHIYDDNIDELIKENNVKELIVSLKGFSDEEIEFLQQKLAKYFQKGINITSNADYIERVTHCVPKENLTKDFYKYFNFSNNHENRLYLLALRCIDLFAGFIGIIAMLLFIPIVFIGNILASRGGLFYKQKRVGAKGEIFEIIKFRSMVTTAEKNGAQWASKNDSRITPFGKFLRKTRIDEIPQFWNVLKGEMSLIGPRPERPEFVKELAEIIPLYPIRHIIKPGLTGWAQVMYPYAATIEEQEEKLRYDLYYIKKRGLFMDFKIVIKTINTVLYFKGQ